MHEDISVEGPPLLAILSELRRDEDIGQERWGTGTVRESRVRAGASGRPRTRHLKGWEGVEEPSKEPEEWPEGAGVCSD